MTWPVEWRLLTVDELCAKVTSGGTPSRSNPEFFAQGTIPWVKTGELTDSYICDTEERITELAIQQSSAKRLPAGTVLMAMYGATVGALGMLKREATCNQACCAMIANPEACDFRWLFYALLNDRTNIVSLATGAAQQNLSGKSIKQFSYMVPPPTEQRAIAEVLGALDDKIAVNSRLGTTAVELADAMFTRAVRGSFPSDQSFADVATIQGGGTPRTKVDEYWNGDIRWATPTDVTGLGLPYLETTSRLITEAGLQACSSVLHPPGSILMTSRATIGAFAIAQEPTAVNQGFIVVNAHDADLQWWLFHEMRSRVPEFLSHANGATFLELSRGKFKKLQVRLASTEVMAAFGERATALHGRARAASVENTRLAGTRDALLPGLMSGKIRVKDAEKTVEEVV